MQQRPAQGGLVFQGLLPVQAGLVGHKGPLAAAGGVQSTEVGPVALRKALLLQIGAVGAVVPDLGDEIAAHKADLGIAVVCKDDLVPVHAVAALLGGDDPDILAAVETDVLLAVKEYRAIGGAGTGANIDLVIIDIGLRAGARQNRGHHTHQHKTQQKSRYDAFYNISFCGRGLQGENRPFCLAARKNGMWILIHNKNNIDGPVCPHIRGEKNKFGRKRKKPHLFCRCG